MDTLKIDPIRIGEKIPDVTLQNTLGEKLKLRKFVSQKPSLLIFYRGGWCPYCNVHLAELGKIELELVGLGIQIFAISPDRIEYLKESEIEHELHYTFLNDSKLEAAKAFGLAYKVDRGTLDALTGYKISLRERSGEEHEMLPVPAAVLVNTDLTVSYIFADEDYTIRINSSVLLDEIKRALHFQAVPV